MLDQTLESRTGLPSQSATSALTKWPLRLQRLIPHLNCPECKSEVVETANGFRCQSCSRVYPIRNGKIYFIESLRAEDSLDVIKARFKKSLGPRFYNSVVNIIGPSYPFNFGRAIRRHVNPKIQTVIDLGCGNLRIDPDVVTLDGSDYEAVDLVADIRALPFKTGSIDALCSCSVLEHVSDLNSSVDEILRCTRKGGMGLHYIPFLFPFHASPYDFTRMTYAGAARLFAGWKVVEQRSGAGPVSVFLLCLVEFLATVFSFGFGRLKSPLYLIFCLFVFPIKILDLFFVGRPSFLGLSASIFTVVRKPQI